LSITLKKYVANSFRFLGDDLPFVEYERCRAVIIPAPLEQTVSFGKGTSFAAEAIIKASGYIELFDEEFGCEPSEMGIYTLQSIPNLLSHDKFLLELEQQVSNILDDKKFPIIIGGEHSLSIAPVKALQNRFDKNFTVLQFDAHTDLREEYENSKNSHACVMRRIYEQNIPIVAAGIRSLCSEEAEFIKEKKIAVFYAKDIFQNDEWIELILEHLTENIYITFDVDVIDPAVISQTGTPEPGGLMWYQLLEIFRKIKKSRKNILGFDFVEFAPQQNAHAESFTCAKLIYKMISYFNR